MNIFLWAVNIAAIGCFIAAMIRLHTLKVERTIGGRAAQGLLMAMLFLGGVGIARRLGLDWWPHAQAIGWTIAGATAIAVAFTRSHQHNRDC